MPKGNAGWSVLVLAVALSAACGDPTVPEDPAVAPFVGTWDAVVMTATLDADTTTVANVLDFGSFRITIEPSGQYTAAVDVLGTPGLEIGDLSVLGPTLRMDPSFPPGSASYTMSYSFTGEDNLTVDGPTEFDFNLDGAPEAAQAHIELRRR